jgi:hypothetical protein
LIGRSSGLVLAIEYWNILILVILELFEKSMEMGTGITARKNAKTEREGRGGVVPGYMMLLLHLFLAIE